MGIFGAIGSFIDSAIDKVTSAVSSIGKTLAQNASKILSVAGPYVQKVGMIVNFVAKMWDVLQHGDNTEELGAKAMQADKKPEDFDTKSEYINYLREKIELDKEKFENASEPEKFARAAVGTKIVIDAVKEKKGFEISIDTLFALVKLGYDRLEGKEKELDAILKEFKEDKGKDLKDYVDSKLDTKKELEVGDKLTEIYKELNPEATDKEIEEKVINMQVGNNGKK